MRLLAFVALALSVVVALALTRMELGRAEDRLGQARERVVGAAVQKTQKALAGDRDKRETQVRVLAENVALRNGITTNEATIKDLIDEEGLRVLRSFPVVVIGREDLPAPLYARGLDQVPTDALQANPVVQAAIRDRGARALSGAIALPNGVALFAATGVTALDAQSHGFLAVGDVLAQKTLGALATESGAALMLSDGARSLWHTGSDADMASMEAMLGQEGQYVERSQVDDTGRVASRVIALAPGASLWVRASVAGEADVIEDGTRLSLILVWALSLGLGSILAFVLWRRGTPAPVVAPAASPGASALDAWAAPSGQSPVGLAGIGTGASVQNVPGPGMSVPVMLPNGQVGQLVMSGAPSVTLPHAGALPTAPTGQTPPAPADPTVFGRYKLLERLGSGGMAEVWIAVAFGAEGFQRAFVVKRIRAEHASNQDLVQQFIDEANLAAQLVHGNVVPVFDFGNMNGEYYLAQEYILGRDLGKLVQALAKRGERLDPKLALYILAETLKALDYAHTLTDKGGVPLGIVHRDVSPNNVLIGGRGEVKLIDFGIAKSATKVSQTEIGTVKGNIRFMAPEQARGELTDPRTDVFSLGATMFYALSGEALYPGTNQYDLLVAAAGGPQERELKKVLSLPPPIGPLLARSLQPLRDDRWPSCQAFLEHIASQVPVDSGRRLAALMQELFGAELREQDEKLHAAARAAQATPASEDATVQRLSTNVKQGFGS